MRLHGYGDDRGAERSGHDEFSADRLVADLGVAPAVAQRAVEQLEAFTFPPVASLVADGTPLLDNPAFWAAHLGSVCRDAAAICDLPMPQTRNPDAWPAFTVPLPAGGVILVVFRTDRLITLDRSCVWVPDQESCVDYWLAPGTGAGMRLAAVSGTQWGPGLRWPELRGIARAAPDRLATAHRLLLLAPVMGDADDGPEAVAWFAQALALVTGRDRREPLVRAVAEALVHDNSLIPPATWARVDGVWCCDGAVSVRNPAGHDPLPADDLRRASAALQPPRAPATARARHTSPG